ncbi:MAG: nuclear transport factor 2 family protein [Roseofilum sp. SID2]|uniref:hypothetical protein n=2 Tax=Roseofilum TaxID=1233426 RepID=UPI001AFEB154|nr:hypothetical protein [Roseofilum sp. SBFL]MBP0015661.1 nuclear transport factor 2 family protein [Roseofilum sp. SID3]MBP0022576.1 nuclear transport factor 2 family protein [Roseofilum sp. SID2]
MSHKMINSVSSHQRRRATLPGSRLWATLLLSISIASTGGNLGVRAAETVPNELKQVIEQIDSNASQQNLQGVLSFYDRQFESEDGLTHSSLAEVLSGFWQEYSQIRYSTNIESWEQEGNAWIAETVTTIQGKKMMMGRSMDMQSEIRSRQRLENQKLVSQEILSERTILTAGDNPPTVDFQLPEQVLIGQRFTLDAIVQEPLGNNVLLGAVLEEPVSADNYLESESIDLELLSAGGLFKLGTAPVIPEPRWISAVLVRGDGITMITQRLRVVKSIQN